MAKKQNYKIRALSSAISETLSLYSKQIEGAVESTGRGVAREALEKLRTAGDYKGRGAYRKSFAVKAETGDPRKPKFTLHSKAPHYRLAHLLEYGHATRSGGRTRSYPHWQPTEEYAQEEFEKRLKDNIEGGEL